MRRNEILCGDARELAKTLPDDSVSMIVTSPPYFGLRDYGCDGQMGLEQTPQEYVAGMVDLFRELRRVLRHDGTLWLNLGSSYAGSGGAGGDYNDGGLKAGQPRYGGTGNVRGFKNKDLIPIPWMVAMALQADEWYLRSDIIWHKKSPMPESVTDRPTKAHEYLFLLSKEPRYFYDAEAVRLEPAPHNKAAMGKPQWFPKAGPDRIHGTNQQNITRYSEVKGANHRTVWTLGPEPYPAAHFATFPRSLVRPCILAGTSAYGTCAACGSPYVRVVERINESNWQERKEMGASKGSLANGHNASHGIGVTHDLPTRQTQTTGWQASCTCDADVVPAIVLDPFMGSGTVAQVAIETGRDWLGFELNPDYVQLAYDRIYGAQPALIAQGITA